MLDVLRHYLPFRKVLLIVSEAVLLTVVVVVGMSAHLWRPLDATLQLISWQGLSVEDARWRCLISAFMVAVLAQLTLSMNELYDFRVSSSRYERMSRFLGSAGSAVLILVLLVSLMNIWAIERVLDFPGLPLVHRIVVLTTTLMVGFTLLYLWRNLFHLLLSRSNFDQRLLILGSGKLAQRLVDDLVSRPDSGYEIVGTLPHDPQGRAPRPDQDRRRKSDPGQAEAATGNPWFEALITTPPKIAAGAEGGEVPGAPELPARALAAGTQLLFARSTEPQTGTRAEELTESLDELAKRLEIDTIIVALQDRRGALPTEPLLRCRLQGIVVQEAEAFYERLTGKIPAEAMRPSYLIFNPGFLQQPMSDFLKRALDLCLAAVGILLAWPLMILTGILVRASSPGPILFRQERTGRHGKSFTLLKFRSMYEDAEKRTGPVWATQDDPRITPLGRFMRKTRLDELPQLFNVLGGSMSMIGPRPERPTFVRDLIEKIPYYGQRHMVKPGLTGWAQINYPYGNTLEDALQKLQYDLFYIKYQSFLFDLSILFNTIKTVVLRKGT